MNRIATAFALAPLCAALSLPAIAMAQQSSGPPGGGLAVNDTLMRDDAITDITAVTEVFGDGQKVTGAIVAFTADLAPGLPAGSLTVDGRQVLSLRVTATPDPDAPAASGRFVVLELDPADAAAVVFDSKTDQAPQLVVRQTASLSRADGGTLTPGAKGIINTRVINRVVDQFQQLRFTDPETGIALNYNLFVPQIAEGARYPLVLFMHDAGVTGSNPLRTLEQGLGAVVFASPDDQARHPAFVLAPQYPAALANDAAQTSDYADVTVRLIQSLTKDRAVDPDRIYTTGQSGGCMTSIALNVAYPDLFAGTFCVAGQWDASVIAPMAKANFWAIVSEDDAKAMPGMTAVVEAMQANGATLTRGTLDARDDAGKTAITVAAIRQQAAGSNVIFTPYVKGSVLNKAEMTNPGAAHMATWQHAYSIPGIRDWLFDQRRNR